MIVNVNIIKRAVALVVSAGLFVACGAENGAETASTASGGTGGQSGSGAVGGGDGAYNFSSRFIEGQSAVQYGSQTARQVLIGELTRYVSGMTEAIDGDTFSPTDTAQVVAALRSFYEFDRDSSGGDPLMLATEPQALQDDMDALLDHLEPSRPLTLASKFAGNDASTDHTDWSTGFVGWSDASVFVDGSSVDTPEALLDAMFSKLAQQAVDRENGIVPHVPGTTDPIAAV